MPNKFATPLLAATLYAASAAGFAAIVTRDFAQYSIAYDYDDAPGAPGFGASFFDSSVDGQVSFGWSIPTSVAVTGTRPATVNDFQMPFFFVRAAPGYTFTGPITGFIGNLDYKETGTGRTEAGIQGAIALDSGNTRNFTRLLDKDPSGFYSGSASLAHPGAFDALVFFGYLSLGARGNANNASITANPQSTFTMSFLAAPVPEPESYAMLLAGLGVIAAFAMKRRPAFGANADA